MWRPVVVDNKPWGMLMAGRRCEFFPEDTGSQLQLAKLDADVGKRWCDEEDKDGIDKVKVETELINRAKENLIDYFKEDVWLLKWSATRLWVVDLIYICMNRMAAKLKRLKNMVYGDRE